MNKKFYLLIGIVIGFLLIELVLLNLSTTTPQPSVTGRLASTWEGTEQNSAQNSLGTFEIKAISVTSKEMLFFYAITNPQNSPFNVLIHSSPRDDDSKLESLDVLKIESLGQLGEYSIGVIHSSWKTLLSRLLNFKSYLPQTKNKFGPLNL